MSIRIVIIGSGGHAKVVIEACRLSRPTDVIDLVDDDPVRAGMRVMDLTVYLRSQEQPFISSEFFHCAIGHNANRKACYESSIEHADRQRPSFATVIHPNAHISPSAQIGEGSFIAAGAVIGPDAVIGKGCIINHNAVIDHDCHVGDWVHIAPSATLGGAVSIADQVFIGASATILPGLTVCEGATVGAGGVVTQDIDEATIFVGIPARKIK